jgi:hypothetical protein
MISMRTLSISVSMVIMKTVVRMQLRAVEAVVVRSSRTHKAVAASHGQRMIWYFGQRSQIFGWRSSMAPVIEDPC